MPPVRVEVAEHQPEIKGGPACEQRVKDDFSADVTQPMPYGPRLRSQAAYLNNYQLIPLAPTCQVLGDSYGRRPAFLGRAGHDHRPAYLSSKNYQPPAKVTLQLGANKPGIFTREAPSSCDRLQLASPDWLIKGQKAGFLDDPLNAYLPRNAGGKQPSPAEKQAHALELIDLLVRCDRKALLVSYATELSWHGRPEASEEKR